MDEYKSFISNFSQSISNVENSYAPQEQYMQCLPSDVPLVSERMIQPAWFTEPPPRYSRSHSSNASCHSHRTQQQFDTSNFIRRRNERERARVRNVNDGFEMLKNRLPLTDIQKEKRLSKVETLRMAINYIHELQDMLQD